MIARRKPRCRFCLKELLKGKHIQLHIANTPKCRAAHDREMNHQSASPSVDSPSDTDPPDLDPMVVDNMGFVGYNETNYVPSERLVVNGEEIRNQSQSEEVEDEDTPEQYAEDYDPVNVAQIL